MRSAWITHPLRQGNRTINSAWAAETKSRPPGDRSRVRARARIRRQVPPRTGFTRRRVFVQANTPPPITSPKPRGGFPGMIRRRCPGRRGPPAPWPPWGGPALANTVTPPPVSAGQTNRAAPETTVTDVPPAPWAQSRPASAAVPAHTQAGTIGDVSGHAAAGSTSCPNCGRAVNAGFAFCGACGTRIAMGAGGAAAVPKTAHMGTPSAATVPRGGSSDPSRGRGGATPCTRRELVAVGKDRCSRATSICLPAMPNSC